MSTQFLLLVLVLGLLATAEIFGMELVYLAVQGCLLLLYWPFRLLRYWLLLPPKDSHRTGRHRE